MICGNLSVIGTRNLPNVYENIMPSTFVTVSFRCGNETFSSSTSVQYGTSSPEWNDKFYFVINENDIHFHFQIKAEEISKNTIIIAEGDLNIFNPQNFFEERYQEIPMQIDANTNTVLCINIIMGNSSFFQKPSMKILDQKNASFCYTFFFPNSQIKLKHSSGEYLFLNSGSNRFFSTVPDERNATVFNVIVLSPHRCALSVNSKIVSFHSNRLILCDAYSISEREVIQIKPITSNRFQLFSPLLNTYLSISFNGKLEATHTSPTSSDYFTHILSHQHQLFFEPGTIVTIKTYNDHYVSIDDNGKIYLNEGPHNFVVSSYQHRMYSFKSILAKRYLSAKISDDLDPTEMTSTTAELHSTYFFLIQSQNGKNHFGIQYLAHPMYKSPAIRTVSWYPNIDLHSESMGVFEEVIIDKIAKQDWLFKGGEYVYIKCNYQKVYLSVGQNNALLTTSREKGPNEKFKLLRTEQFQHYHIVGSNNKYVYTHDGSVYCNGNDDPKLLRCFEFEQNEQNNIFLLEQSTKKYVTVEKNLVVNCNRDLGKSHEKFSIETEDETAIKF